MLVHAYLGALVFGGVMLAASLLLDARGPLRVVSLGFWGFVLSFFGLTTVSMRMAGLADDQVTATVGAAVGLGFAALAMALGRRRRGA